MLQLGKDILEVSLFPLLEPEDLFALRETCRGLNNLVLASNVWRSLYHRDFGIKPHEDLPSWSELYIRRRSAKIFFWGIYSSDNGGEGVASRPITLPGVGEPIRDVNCTPGFVVVHDIKGQLWRVTFSSDSKQVIDKPAQQLTSNGVSIFTAFHCSYFEVMACDQQGVWHLWSGVDDSTASFQLPFPTSSTLVSMCALTTLKLFYAPHKGLVIASVYCAKSGADTNSFVVPNTNGSGDDEVVDAALGVGSKRALAAGQFVVHLNRAGDLFLTTVPVDSLVNPEIRGLEERDIVTTAFPFYDRVAGPKTKFVKVAAECNRFVALTDSGRVLEIKLVEGNIFGEIGMRIVPDLHNVVDVALGFGHSVAVTSEGEILTWGCDSAHSGCFGLGSDEELAQAGARFEKGQFSDREILDTPHTVPCSPAVRVRASLASTVALGLTSYDEDP